MAKKKVTVEIAGKETVSTAARKAGDSVNKLGSSGRAGMAGFATAMVGVNQALELMRKAAQAVEAAFDFAKQGALDVQLRKAFDFMTEAANESSNEILAAMERASKGTIAQTDLMIAANKAMLTDLPVQDLERLMEIARAAAITTGKEVSDTFNQLVQGVQRGTSRALQGAGVMLNATLVANDYADAIGKTAMELTAMERQQAFLNATLEVGDEIIQRVGSSLEELTDLEAMNQYTKQMEDFKSNLAGIANELVQRVIPFMTEFLEKTNTLLEIRQNRNILRDLIKIGPEGGFIDPTASRSDLERGITAQGPILEAAATALEEAEAGLVNAFRVRGEAQDQGRLARDLADQMFNQFNLAYSQASNDLVDQSAIMADLTAVLEELLQEERNAAARAERLAFESGDVERMVREPSVVAAKLISDTLTNDVLPAILDWEAVLTGALPTMTLAGGSGLRPSFIPPAPFKPLDLEGFEDEWQGHLDRQAISFDLHMDQFIDNMDVTSKQAFDKMKDIIVFDAKGDISKRPSIKGTDLEGIDLMAILAEALEVLAANVESVAMILDFGNTILAEFFTIIGPALDSILIPLIGILALLANVVAQVLLPVLNLLGPVIQLVAEVFLWLYNHVFRHIGNVMIVFFGAIFNAIIAFVNVIFSAINFLLGWLGVSIGLLSQFDVQGNVLGPVSLEDLTTAGTTAVGGTTGDNTTVSRAPDINVFITVQGNIIGAGGAAQFGQLVAESLVAYAGVGGNVNILIQGGPA